MSAVWGSDALSEDDLLKQIEKEIQDININSEPSNNNNFAKPATPTTTNEPISRKSVKKEAIYGAMPPVSPSPTPTSESNTSPLNKNSGIYGSMPIPIQNVPPPSTTTTSVSNSSPTPQAFQPPPPATPSTYLKTSQQSVSPTPATTSPSPTPTSSAQQTTSPALNSSSSTIPTTPTTKRRIKVLVPESGAGIGGFLYIGDKVQTMEEALQTVCKKRHLEPDKSKYRFRYIDSSDNLAWELTTAQIEGDSLKLIDISLEKTNTEAEKKEARKSNTPSLLQTFKRGSQQLARSVMTSERDLKSSTDLTITQSNPSPQIFVPTGAPTANPDGSELTKKQVAFHNLSQEIIATEQNYVNDLKLIYELYIQPLKASKLLNPNEVSQLFSNIIEIKNLNELVLQELLQQTKPIGDLFISYNDYFKMYAKYCGDQEMALVTLQKLEKKNSAFRAFLLETKQNPRCRLLGLEAFLMTPIQRICKYPLLLRELAKSVEDNDPMGATITSACEKISSVVANINESKKKIENMRATAQLADNIDGMPQEMVLIAPGREFLSEIGDIQLTVGDKQQPGVVLLLLSDMVMVVKENSAALLKKKYGYVCHVVLDRSFLKQIPASSDIEMLDLESKVKYVISSKSPEQQQILFNKLVLSQANRKRADVVFQEMLNKVYKEGWIEHLGRANLQNVWKLRYVVVRFGEIEIFKESEGKANDRIVLEVSTTISKQGENQLELKVEGRSRPIDLKLGDDKQCKEWLNAIVTSKVHFNAQKNSKSSMVYERVPISMQ